MTQRVFIQGIPVDVSSRAQLLALLEQWLESGERPRHIITLNSNMLMHALKDQYFKAVICKADLVTVDGYGIARAIHQLGHRLIERCTGLDLVRSMLAKCERDGGKVYFYGGSKQVVTALTRIIPEQWPNLSNFMMIRDGYQSAEARWKIKAEIMEVQPNILLVALGSPQQELFLAELMPYLHGTLGIGVGGAFEVLAGCKREAPKFIRDHGWEWCFRMFQEPRRLNRLPDLIRFWYLCLRSNGK